MNVAILSFQHTALFELACAVELFALPRPEFNNWYDAEVVSFNKQAAQVTGGISFNCKTIHNLNAYDLVVVPNWTTQADQIPKTLAIELKAFHQQGKRIISFCSGAFLLAELGILDDTKALTHWRYAEQFKQRFPHLNYIDDVLHHYNGTVGCSAGSSAAIDLGLEVIRADFGYEIANSVARRLVISAHRKGGQAQFSDLEIKQENNHFNQALDWALKQITKPLSVNDLADRANMSRRTFDRKFKAHLNLTPKEWITYQRLNIAKQHLEKFDFDIEKIASISGFENATTMRHHFRKEFGVSPSVHRTQFNSNELICR